MIPVAPLVSLVVGVVVVPPVVYFGVPLGSTAGSVSAREAVAVSLAGVVAAGLADALFGGVAVVGWLFAPLTWVVVVGYRCPVEWPTAAGVGVVGWATHAITLRVLLMLLAL